MVEPVIAESVDPGEEDLRQWALVEDLLKTENKAISDFAKHVVTVSFAAIGVVLTLTEKWLGAAPGDTPKALLGLAIVLFLAASAFGSFAARAFAHRVTLADFGEVESELRRVARTRHQLVSVGFALLLLATAVVAYVALS